jgi:hypothetical protein
MMLLEKSISVLIDTSLREQSVKSFFLGFVGTLVAIAAFLAVYPQYSAYRAAAETSEWVAHTRAMTEQIEEVILKRGNVDGFRLASIPRQLLYLALHWRFVKIRYPFLSQQLTLAASYAAFAIQIKPAYQPLKPSPGLPSSAFLICQ